VWYSNYSDLFWISYWSILLLVLFLCFLLSSKKPKASLFQSDQDEIWQDCSSSECVLIDEKAQASVISNPDTGMFPEWITEYASIDRVRFWIWCHTIWSQLWCHFAKASSRPHVTSISLLYVPQYLIHSQVSHSSWNSLKNLPCP